MISKFKGFRSEVETEIVGKTKVKRLDLYIYDVIAWWGVSAADVAKAIEEAGEVDVLNIYINSPGGSVWEGMAIHSLLRRHSAQRNVFVDSIAASMGSVVAMVGHTITMMPGSMIMIHNPSGGVFGEAKDMVKYATILDKIKASIIAIYKKRTLNTDLQIEDWMDEETWFTADEAVENGFADAIDEDGEDVEMMFDLSHFNHVPDRFAHSNAVPVCGWNDMIQKADQVALSTAASADLSDFDSLISAVTKSDRTERSDKKKSVRSRKETYMDPKLMQALQKAGLIVPTATKGTAEAVLALWFEMQNRTKPDDVDEIVAAIEAGPQYDVPDGKLLTTQAEIDLQVSSAVETATAELTESHGTEMKTAVETAVTEVLTQVKDTLERCETAQRPLSAAIKLVGLPTDEVKDTLFNALCNERKSVGSDDDSGGNSKDDRFRAEYKAGGGEEVLGVTIEEYIESRQRDDAGGTIRVER